jgi:1-acyl-sn-glycerol-3-phosphate acyltransferase
MIPQIAGTEKAPRYALPPRLVIGLVWAALAQRSRSFAHDARWAVSGLRPPLRVLGAEHIPVRGPCLVACNHYSRPGFGAWWIALGISAAVAERRAPGADQEIHWVMTAAWTFPESRWKHRLLTPLTRCAFARVARVYGFVPMPPMPPDPDEVEARARAVLRTVRLARQIARRPGRADVGGMIGLAPEGQDVPGESGAPRFERTLPDGAGEFLALLAQAGLAVLPVWVGERAGGLCVSFGPPFEPDIPVERDVRDLVVGRQVMSAIARQSSDRALTFARECAKIDS